MLFSDILPSGYVTLMKIYFKAKYVHLFRNPKVFYTSHPISSPPVFHRASIHPLPASSLASGFASSVYHLSLYCLICLLLFSSSALSQDRSPLPQSKQQNFTRLEWSASFLFCFSSSFHFPTLKK